MKIAILVPSRERMNNRLTLLLSILLTVKNIENVNVYYGVDKDDPTLKTIQKLSSAIPCVKVIEIDNKGEFLGLGKLWNILADATSEDIISMIGDDMVFKTPDWDETLLSEFKKMPSDKIQAIHCNDGFHGPRLAVNMFVHRQYVNVMGRFMREEFKINWVDTWLHQVFSAFNRLKYLGDIMIEHRHWVFGKSKRDETAERMAKADEGKFSDNLWPALAGERVKDVEKLAEYLNQVPDWSKVDR